MKKILRSVKAGVAVVAVVLAGSVAFGSVPFNNLQGVGGAAFNPLAYPAGQNKADGTVGPLSRPQFGVWYTHLGEVDVDWTAFGVAETLFDRVEVSYGYELIAPKGENINKSNVGGKVLLVPENAGGKKFIPAVSVGTIWKTASNVATGSDDSGVDFYGVATKLITQLPFPVLLSGGILSTKEQVTGVFGFNSDRDVTGFGNIDFIPLSSLAVGFEFKQGASYDSFKNANYWEAHLAWIANKNLTLVGAYVNAGDSDSTSKVGLGDGVVVSAQYAY
jgi:hypothetical protein